ncbi:hypothetical protein [Wenyingzhuangia marina]|uniref:Integron Cassette Protein Hfx-Cass5 domain-containing protein n=1 Tax=Wenyingzhuangia marina TaxID=1195760 RepID=A0A1M5U4H9_9FLAO|nr:hypothetical protein [Wenyingzhuangia marina]GGF69712.1 hypothetical protein GCM10011397_10830 [Wenyingzhuangia marina]SHH57583.1 hypothetical protein SAMN05444281_1014 [Wenyingzhuangia marina]
MKNEIIEKIVVNEKRELILKIMGNGRSIYQYVYREAAGVYWDNNQKAFKSTSINEWTVSQWFFHIKDILKLSLNVELTIDKNVDWENISDEEKRKIKTHYNTG